MNPHRPRLSSLVAAEIREGIARGRWTEWLPQERLLADQLYVSRSVLRQAMASIKTEGLIRSHPGRGNRIIRRTPRPSGRRTDTRIIGLLTPGSIDEMRPLVTLRLDDFRKELAEENCELQIIESKSCYKERPAAALAAMRANYPSVNCWVLRLSTRPMQEWFLQQRLPAVVLGNCHQGVSLPFVAFDRRALSRHAVSMMTRAGHRNFTLLISRDSRGGDLASEEGFRDAVAKAQRHHPDLRADIVHHDESVQGVVTRLGKLLAQPHRPTAIFVAQAIYYPTVACDLARRGIRIPEDISLMTDVGSPLLAYMLPRPAFYEVSSRKFARKLVAVVLAILRGESISARFGEILPTYVSGASLGHLRREKSSSGLPLD